MICPATRGGDSTCCRYSAKILRWPVDAGSLRFAYLNFTSSSSLLILYEPSAATIAWLLKRLTAEPRNLSLWFHSGSAPDFGIGNGKPSSAPCTSSVPVSDARVAL